MPGEVGGVRPESGLRCEAERAAVQVGEFEVRATGKDGFGDVGMGHADTQVVMDGQEPGIEEFRCGRQREKTQL